MYIIFEEIFFCVSSNLFHNEGSHKQLNIPKNDLLVFMHFYVSPHCQFSTCFTVARSIVLYKKKYSVCITTKRNYFLLKNYLP